MFIMGEREKEREREREREKERERERDGESTLQDHIITMRWELHYIRVYPTIISCVDPRYQLSRFFTGISRRKYEELISLIGNQRVEIFPAKIWNSLRLIPSFDMISKFPGSDHSSRRRYVAKLLAERINNNNKNERDTCWLAFAEVVRKNHGNNIAGRSSDSPLAFKQIFNDYGEIWKERRWKVT